MQECEAGESQGTATISVNDNFLRISECARVHESLVGVLGIDTPVNYLKSDPAFSRFEIQESADQNQGCINIESGINLCDKRAETTVVGDFLSDKISRIIIFLSVQLLLIGFVLLAKFRLLDPTRYFIDAMANLAQGDYSKMKNTAIPPILYPFRKAMAAIIENHVAFLATRDSISAREVTNAIAGQLAHDIRSPLSALNMVMGAAEEIPEEKRLIIRSAVQRINDIANGLLSLRKKQNAEVVERSEHIEFSEPVMLVALLDSLVSEKRVQFRERMDVEIHGELQAGYGLFAKIHPTELGRVVSNIINNSVEAIIEKGRITVDICEFGNQIKINIEDNGRGIPRHILTHLGRQGVSYGKEGLTSGTGLGLFHARETLEKAGGSMTIQSEEDRGTKVTLSLPKCETPSWFVERLDINSSQVIVSVDDDQTIHQIWADKIGAMTKRGAAINHLRFSTLDQLELWVDNNVVSDELFLVDYEFLGQTSNGIDAIKKLNIQSRAIVVTSRYEECQVREKAKALGLKILPKGLAPLVPIDFSAY